jgi:hypothetical protein
MDNSLDYRTGNLLKEPDLARTERSEAGCSYAKAKWVGDCRRYNIAGSTMYSNL